MKTRLILLTTLISGFLLGYVAMLAKTRLSDVRHQYVQPSDILREALHKLGAEASSEAIEVFVRDWEFAIAEGDSRSFVFGGSSEGTGPVIVLEKKRDGGIERVSLEDSSGQIVVLSITGSGEFESYSAWIAHSDGEQICYMDESFSGFFSRAVLANEAGVVWGNLSEEEWLPLKKGEEGMEALRNEEWLPVKWKDGRLVFDEGDGDDLVQ